MTRAQRLIERWADSDDVPEDAAEVFAAIFGRPLEAGEDAVSHVCAAASVLTRAEAARVIELLG